MQIDCHLDAFQLGEGFEIDDRNRCVIVRYAVSARICDIESIAHHGHLLGLVADHTLAHDREGCGVDFDDFTRSRIGIDLHGTRIRTDVGVALVEGDVAAVCDRNGTDMLGCREVHHLDQIRAVDHRIQTLAIDLQVVAHVAQLLDNVWIALRKDVARILARLVIEVVQRGLVASHISLVQQEESLHVAHHRIGIGNDGIVGRKDGLDIVAATHQSQRQKADY